MNRQEAIRIVKNNWPNDRLLLSEALEFLIPELQESKGDKIRKMIRGWIYTRPSSFFDNGVSKEETLAWLEKQGEKKANENNEEIPLSKQKPADNDEPKFKVGDWIVYDGVTYLITGAYPDGYTNDQQGFFPLKHQDEMRLWNIFKDAKDGDVLEFKDHERVVIGIVSFVNEKTGKIDVSCLLDNNNFKIGNFYALDTINPHPATMEQRVLLFSKMGEAGYTWDAKKKELRKIEQKPAEIDKNSDITDALRIEYEKGRADAIAEMRSSMSQSHQGTFSPSDSIARELQRRHDKQKSIDAENKADAIAKMKKYTWSEEDGNMLNSILDEYKSMCKEKRDWLKSLKHQLHWKPSKEQIKALKWVLANVPYCTHKEEINGLYEQLKSL